MTYIIDTCIQITFSDKTNINDLTIANFHKLLTIIISQQLVIFGGDYSRNNSKYLSKTVIVTLNLSNSVKILVTLAEAKPENIRVFDDMIAKTAPN